MLSYQIYVHLENRRTFKTQIIDEFPKVYNYAKLSAKCFLSSAKVTDTVGFLSFFKSFTRTTIKTPLVTFCTAKATNQITITDFCTYLTRAITD